MFKVIGKYIWSVIILQCLFIEVSAQSQPLKLWYEQPASKWTEALPIGNGRIGAMVFGGVAQDRVQFNEETLWTGGPRNYNRPGAGKYLDTIRQLLFAGKQKEAEQLAEEKFMGMRSNEGSKTDWVNQMKSLKGVKGNPALEKYDDGQWKTMPVPSYEGWEAVGFEGLDGAVWFRTYFNLPVDWFSKNLVLDLNRIRDHDFTYVNGHLVGSMESTEGRKYVIPAKYLHPGQNTLAIQVLNYFDKGGIAGYKDTTRIINLYPEKDTEFGRLPLTGNWKYFIQNDEPPAVPRYQADYQPFGDLWMEFENTIGATGYRRELDISNSISTTSYSLNGVNYKREYFVSQPAQLAVIRITGDKSSAVSFSARLSSPHKYSSVRKINNNTIGLSLKVKNGALRGESYLQVNASKGIVEVQGDRIIIRNADEVVLYLSAGTNYKNYKDITGDPIAICRNSLQNAVNKTYQQLKDAHVKEYQSYFNTLSFDLGRSENEKLPTDARIKQFATSNDPAFAALYLQYGRYLLISASRPGSRPANLQGIWNDLLAPPWGSKYTTNINAEMNYWPAELLNLSPMHEPLFNMISELAEAGKGTARIHYNAPGWVLHHNTDLWRGTAPINASNHGIWVSGGAWLCHHLWEHYLYTQDKAFLKERAYPIMKEAALFFNSFLVKDPKTGWLISTPSNSPEQGGLVAGPTMDHQIIRDLFKNVIEASGILGIDKSFADTLQSKYARIAPNQVGKYGQLQEWMQDKDDTSSRHRHVSHLWGLYPGSEINYDETPKLVDAARQSLLYRGDAATGWSLGWKINFWARFRDGDHAYRLIQMLLSPAGNAAGSYPNLFDAHPPFQIDGNFGGAAGIGELLLQSHTKYIDLLPALPSGWSGGEIKGIKARGGFELTIKWNNGQLQLVEILSTAGNSCNLRYGTKTVSFATQKGKGYRLDNKLELLK